MFAGLRECDSTEQAGIISGIQKSKNLMQASLQEDFWIFDPPKHENAAIFRRKMSGIRMFAGLRECDSTEQAGIIIQYGELSMEKEGSACIMNCT